MNERVCNDWAQHLFKCKVRTRNPEPIEHECCSDPSNRQAFCRPENGSMLVARGAMDPRQNRENMSHIYVCDLWNIHECTPGKCGLYHETTVCPISGIVHGQQLVTDLRYREVHMVKPTAPGRMARETQARADTRVSNAIIQQTTTTPVIRRIEGEAEGGGGGSAPHATTDGTEDERILALSLLRRLAGVASRGSSLDGKLTALLEDTQKSFKKKVSSMAQLMLANADQTRFNGNTDRIREWVKSQLSDFRSYVHAQRKAAEREARQEATATRVTATRQMAHLGGNMFEMSGSVIVQDEEVKEEEISKRERELREKNARMVQRHQRKKRARASIRRDEEGRLRVPIRRDEIEDEDSELDEEERMREMRDMQSRRASLTQTVHEHFRRRCKDFIYHLLWGPCRRAVLRSYQRTLRNQFTGLYRRYTGNLPGDQLVELGITNVEKEEINHNVYRSPPLTIIEYDDALMDKCLEMVTHVWKVVTLHGPNTFSNAGEIVVVLVTLATLYKVRGHGLIIEDTVIIPPDIRMHHLPQLSDLTHFRQEKHLNMNSYSRSYTQGVQLVNDSFRHALKRGVPMNKLRMNLRSMKSSYVREGDVERRNEVQMFAVGKRKRSAAK